MGKGPDRPDRLCAAEIAALPMKCFDCKRKKYRSYFAVYQLPNGKRLSVCRDCYRRKYEPWGVKGKRHV